MGEVGRRRFLTALCAGALAKPLSCLSQSLGKVPRIGMLLVDSAASQFGRTRRDWAIESLGRAGYRVGTDIVLEWRFAEGKREHLRELADELVQTGMDVIVAWTWLAIHAARDATQSIPVVMYGYGDDVIKQGIAKSLARPGGNITGTLWNIDPAELVLKQTQLLREAAPNAVRLASLWWPWSPKAREWVNRVNARSNREFGFLVTDFVVDRAEEIPSALQRIAEFAPDALWVANQPITRPRFSEIAAFALQKKLISFSDGPNWPEAGGLLYYGADVRHLVDRTMSYVVRILQGARPGDLPIEQPDRFELVFNARTAQAIGYALPSAVRLRVNRVIE